MVQTAIETTLGTENRGDGTLGIVSRDDRSGVWKAEKRMRKVQKLAATRSNYHPQYCRNQGRMGSSESSWAEIALETGTLRATADTAEDRVPVKGQERKVGISWHLSSSGPLIFCSVSG
jgi:hypothetical protein